MSLAQPGTLEPLPMRDFCRFRGGSVLLQHAGQFPDGNHGRVLAAAAHSEGCWCVIVLHANVSAEREEAIAAFGAEVIRIDGNYDESVEHTEQISKINGWSAVSDTSYEGCGSNRRAH